MKLKLFPIFIVFVFDCFGQSTKEYNIQDIGYKNIVEINNLLYFKVDTSLVSGKVIRYNRKSEAKSYILVTNGKPDVLGWKPIKKSSYILPFKPIFEKTNVQTNENELAPFDETTRKDFNRRNRMELEIEKNNNQVGVKTYGENQIKSEDKEDESYEDGPWEDYFDNGRLMAQGSYLDGKKDGVWKEFFENGSLNSESHYVKGKKQNLFVLFHSNGQLKAKINYEDGKEDGIFEIYHENGNLMIVGNYLAGKMIGEWRYFDENGDLINIEKYEN